MRSQSFERVPNQFQGGSSILQKTDLSGFRCDKRMPVPISPHPCSKTQLGSDGGVYWASFAHLGQSPCFLKASIRLGDGLCHGTAQTVYHTLALHIDGRSLRSDLLRSPPSFQYDF